MRKIWTLFLCTILLLGTLLALMSCATAQGVTPNLDLWEAERNLERSGYSVDIYDGEGKAAKRTLSAYDGQGDENIFIVMCVDSKIARMYYEDQKNIYNSKVREYEGKIRGYEIQIETIEYYLSRYERDLDYSYISSMEYALREAKEDLWEAERELREYKENTCFGVSGVYAWSGSLRGVMATH